MRVPDYDGSSPLLWAAVYTHNMYVHFPALSTVTDQAAFHMESIVPAHMYTQRTEITECVTVDNNMYNSVQLHM